MDKWTRDVLPLTRSQIEIAVRDGSWQIVRTKLKGTPTRYKLAVLDRYLQDLGDLSDIPKDSCSLLLVEQQLREWRVSNYINALKRGGQLNSNLEVAR